MFWYIEIESWDMGWWLIDTSRPTCSHSDFVVFYTPDMFCGSWSSECHVTVVF